MTNEAKQLTTLSPIVDLTSIEYGLDFILSHLPTPHFPRRISTYLTVGRQITVNSRDEALARFKQSNLIDCRMSAYPYPVPEIDGINAQMPTFFLSDLDRKSFKTGELLKQALAKTLQNYSTKLHGADWWWLPSTPNP
jgi:hypothetical protein